MKKIFSSIMALVLCFSMLISTTACTQQDTMKVVNLIVAELPTAIQLATTILQLTGNLKLAGVDEATISDVNHVGGDVVTGLQELDRLAKVYQTTKDKKVFTQIIAIVDNIITETDSQLLNVAHIKNEENRQKVTLGLGALSTVLHVIDGYLLSIESSQEIQAKVQMRSVKIKQIQDKLNRAYIDEKAAPFHSNFDQMVAYETSLGL